VAGALIAGGSFFSPGLRTVWLLAAAGCVLGTLNSIPYAVLAGTQKWRGLSIAALTTNTVGTLATIGVLYLGGGIEGMFATTVVMSAVALAWTGTLARRALPTPTGGDAGFDDLRKPLVRFAGVTWVAFVLSLIVWKRSEFFFLKRYSTDAQIAFYSIAFAAVISLTSAMEAISLVLAPAVATLSGAGANHRIRSGVGRAIRVLLLGTFPLTAGAMAVGPATIALVYGNQYMGTTVPLLILLVVTPLLPLMSLSTALLWGLGRTKVWLTVVASSAVVNVALDFLVIPAHGAVGAAIANTGAQVAAAAGIVTYACRQMAPVEWHASALVRAATAAAACGGGAWLVDSRIGGVIGIVLGVIAGFVTFAALAVTLRILPAADAIWLEGIVGDRLGGLPGASCRLLSTGRPRRRDRGNGAAPLLPPDPS
jgi:O-antigen/teichoic acid export membrane protein